MIFVEAIKTFARYGDNVDFFSVKQKGNKFILK